MLPSYFVQLPEIPLTPNGKVDKKSLPSPNGLGLSTGVEYVAPRNEIEEKLVAIWEEVLNKEKVGVKDDFFELGGHSLKAMRLLSEYHKSFDSKFELKDLFIQHLPHVTGYRKNTQLQKMKKFCQNILML